MPSGAQLTTLSPGMPSGSRLVASTRSRGQEASSRSTTSAAGSITCSQLSTSSNASRGRSHSTSRSIGSTGSPLAGHVDDVPVEQTVDGAERLHHAGQLGHRREVHEPGAELRTSAAVDRSTTSVASRVLPAPPGPTIVTSRPLASCLDSRATSSSRPTSRVNGARDVA